MKALFLSVLALVFLPFFLVVQAQSISINNDGSAPHPSAMLDVNSSTKGLLIPRMGSAARIAIATPASGLLVYDTTTKSFWFHNGTSWTESPKGANYWTGDGYSIWSTNPGYVIAGSITLNSLPYGRLMIGTPDDWSSPIFSGVDILDYSADGTNAMAFFQSATNSHWYSSTNIVLIPAPSSNVGIATYTPASKLQIGEVGSTGYGGNHIAFGNGTNATGIVQNNTICQWYSTTNIAFMPQNGTGAFGIGTITPVCKLEVKSPDGTYGILHSNSSGTIRVGTYVGSNGGWLGTQTNNPLYFFANNSNALMTVLPNGNVGIGTINPVYKLAVNGSIQTKEVRVETGWADFVFEKNYRLPSLPTVEKFLARNKHLPGIPSAKQIQDKGLELGNMQTKMMQKIEELTLYIIQLQKQIDELKKK